MPLLIVFLLLAACLPVDWPAAPFGLGRRDSAILTAVAVFIPLACAFALRTWVVHSLRREPLRRGEVGRAYSRIRYGLYFFNLGCVLLAILGLGWGWTVQHTLLMKQPGHDVLAPFAELLVPLPYFAILFGLWVIYFDAERALHRARFASGGGPPFWSRAGFVFHNLRQTLFLVMLPVGLYATQQTAIRWFPEAAETLWFKVTPLAVVPMIVLLLPLAIKPWLGLRSLPPGPTRDRLEALARRLRFRCADLLVWPTRGGMVNALVVGLVPRIRYVVFTDRLLDELPPEELDAVFGHEAGHGKHGHIWYYALFIGLSMTALAAATVFTTDSLLNRVPIPKELEKWLMLLPVALMAAYFFVVFGFLSRRCERQADVFGARAVSCGNPACIGHDEGTIFPHGEWGLCPTGLRTCAHALERVFFLNGGEYSDGFLRAVLMWFRSWLHGPIPRRVAYMLSLIDNPARERGFQRSVAVLRWGLVLVLAVVILVFGELVGWNALLQSL